MSSNDYDIAAIYEKHKDVMHRMAYAILREHDLTAEAEDVVHNVITEILSKPPSKHVENWQAYLVKAIKLRALDKIKEAFVKNRDRSSAEPPDLTDSTQDLSQNVADDLERLADAAHLHELLATLPPQERQILWRVFGLEEKQRAVADEMGLSPGRISQIRKVGLAKLRAQMTGLRTNP